MADERKNIDPIDELVTEAKAWANREIFLYRALNSSEKIPDRVDLVVRLVKEVERLRNVKPEVSE